MNSEKVKEIKKALECCSTLMDNNATSEEQDNSCNECPYRLNDRCSWKLDGDALTLINDLESENERLSKELDSEWKDRRKAEEDLHKAQWNYKIGLAQSRKRNKELKDRIAELENIGLNENITVAEYLREMQRLKDRVAELEKELTNDRVFYKDGICYPINCQGALKQFAERLKDDIEHHHGNYGDLSYSECEHIIDETLKEFI